MIVVRLGAWSFGRKGQLGSVAVGNKVIVPLPPNYTQVETHCTFAQDQTGYQEGWAVPLTWRAHCSACQYIVSSSSTDIFAAFARSATADHSPDSCASIRR